MQLHQPDILKSFARADARLLVVSFAPLDRLKDWVPYWRESFLERHARREGRSVPEEALARTRFLSDAGRGVYRAYGLGRISPWRAYGPAITWQYLKWIAGGRRLRMPDGDTLQGGGDFVINREGRLTLSHAGRDQSERPTPAEIIAALSR